MEETSPPTASELDTIYANPQRAQRRAGSRAQVDAVVVLLAVLDEVRQIREQLGRSAA